MSAHLADTVRHTPIEGAAQVATVHLAVCVATPNAHFVCPHLLVPTAHPTNDDTKEITLAGTRQHVAVCTPVPYDAAKEAFRKLSLHTAPRSLETRHILTESSS